MIYAPRRLCGPYWLRFGRRLSRRREGVDDFPVQRRTLLDQHQGVSRGEALTQFGWPPFRIGEHDYVMAGEHRVKAKRAKGIGVVIQNHNLHSAFPSFRPASERHPGAFDRISLR
jgi:hypothetical protein